MIYEIHTLISLKIKKYFFPISYYSFFCFQLLSSGTWRILKQQQMTFKSPLSLNKKHKSYVSPVAYLSPIYDHIHFDKNWLKTFENITQSHSTHPLSPHTHAHRRKWEKKIYLHSVDALYTVPTFNAKTRKKENKRRTHVFFEENTV